MTIYIDKDYKCYTEPAEDSMTVETNYFDGKCKTFIEGYRFVPAGQEWTRNDGVVFKGEMIAPWRNMEILLAAQEQYEESLAELEDMRAALLLLEVDPLEEVQDNG